MARQDLILRTKKFALDIVRLCGSLPNRPESWVLGKQLLRSGTSIGANYREAQRLRSDPEFLSKVHIVQQEIEETSYWLELLFEANLAVGEPIECLMAEVLELKAIFIAIARKVTERMRSVLPSALSP